LGVAITGTTCSGSGGVGCPGAIPDAADDPAGGIGIPASMTSTFDVADCNQIVDVDVGVDTTHSWVGDLSYTVTSPGGVSVTIIDRPMTPLDDLGNPTTFGCWGADIEAMLNDSAAAPVEFECAAATPTIDGIYSPNELLSAFNGTLGDGAWTLTVTDNAFEDSGTLNDWSLDLACINQADLGVTKDITVGAPVAGTQMTYTVEVSNLGPATAVGVMVDEVIPAGTTFVDTSGCDNDPSGVPTCSLGDMAAGAVVTYDVTVDIAADLPSGAALTNVATVSSATEDPNGTNDSVTHDSTASRTAAISITKSGAAAVVAGSGDANACYSVFVENAGPSSVTGLEIGDSWTSWTGVSCAATSDCGPWAVDLAAGGDTTIDFCLTVGSSAPEGTITNTAMVNGSAGGEDLEYPNGQDSSVDTVISREATLVLTKTASDTEVTAGNWEDLSFDISVANSGPSDVDGLVLSDTLSVSGASAAVVTCDNGLPGTTSFTVGDLAAGATSGTFTVTCDVPLTAVTGDVVSNSASFSSSTGGETITSNTASASSTIVWAEADFNVSKLYPGAPGPSVWFDLVCSTGSADGAGALPGDYTDATVTLVRFETGTDCEVVEVVPDGYYELTGERQFSDCDVDPVAEGGDYDCVLHNAETVARFHVTKDFSDGSTDDVNVTLTCDTGLPLTQMLTISGGDPTGVTFVVKDYVDGTMSCSVTEVTNTDGYDVDESGCVWPLVNSIDGPFACVVNNTAQDARFTANMMWEIYNEGGDVVDETLLVTITCDAEITGSNGTVSVDKRMASRVLGDGDALWVDVSTLTGPANCSATQESPASGVESSDDCYDHTLTAGGSSSCTFYNTVFFEGIPTLSQYGLAILALLMLGVGMVGFRRFV
jgi:uncharacterized repeat protein (TIGR01451 family)